MKLNNIMIFVSGAVVGSTITYIVAKKVIRKKADEEIRSVRAAFVDVTLQKEKEAKEAEEALKEYSGASNTDDSVAVKIPTDQNEKEPIYTAEDRQKSSEEGGVIRSTLTDEDWKKITNNKKHLIPKEGEPYVITPDEFGQKDGYDTESMTYYLDGVLVRDMTGEVVRHLDEVVGRDNLNHFGEFEPEMLYIRDPVEQCDYDIALAEETYKETKK